MRDDDADGLGVGYLRERIDYLRTYKALPRIEDTGEKRNGYRVRNVLEEPNSDRPRDSDGGLKSSS